MRQRRRWRRLRVCGAALLYGCVAASSAWALPNDRGYELVSPVAKHGAGVISDSRRTRAAADGNAVGFISLGAFADAMGTGVATDYVSERTTTPGTSGWVTHAITPFQSGTTYNGLLVGLEPLYVGEFSADLSTGVFFAPSPLTADPSTANVTNLYLRRDLRTPGTGTYALLTRCPYCDASGTPLPAATSPSAAEAMRPFLAWMSPDASHIAFESSLRLTGDTPPALNRVEVYEWDHGAVTLAGRLPRSGATVCDDLDGPACVGSQFSLAGRGASTIPTRTPHVVSDGSDGHTRLFFTFPTASGLTPNPGSSAGQLYMRVDGTSTVHLNVSERRTSDAFAPAEFLDASSDGERVFFMTTQALTDDAPVNGESKIYVYDATQPPSAPNHLTLVNVDREPGDTTLSDGQGIVGLSDDGRYVYFITTGQIVSGQPLLGPATPGLYLWHDGVVRFIASMAGAEEGELLSTGSNFVFRIRQARVTPDGRWLLYRTLTDTARQLYLYGADGNTVVCVSCNPSGPSATTDATDAVQTDIGGTLPSWHENRALSDDGSRVFFSTGEALVPEDVNGRADVYEYDVAAGRAFLISSGTSPDDSWFMDAGADGGDVFFTTRQQLVGWDTDQEYDVYDARVGGGRPEPPPNTPPCAGDACRGALSSPPLVPPGASDVLRGAGNAGGTPRPAVKPCRRGFVHKRVRGRLRCVKKRKRKHVARKRRARARSGRRGRAA